MLHAGFTIVGREARIIIKDAERRVIHQERLDMGDSRGENAEWLACKAAIRLAGSLSRDELKLYSDCGVITQLERLEAAHKIKRECRAPVGYGPLAQYVSRELFHFYDSVAMLWMLFNGKWEAYQVTQERILNGRAI